MDPLGVRLARALMNAEAGGLLANPPGLSAIVGDVIEVTSYKGERQASIDGKSCEIPRPLALLGEREGADFALRADRLDETLWVVDVKPL